MTLIVLARALVTGVQSQLADLPQIIALVAVAAAYEVLALTIVGRTLRRGADLPDWAWGINIVVEALIPTVAVLIITESRFIGPYRALAAPARMPITSSSSSRP